MNAKEFSKSNQCDADWVEAMGDAEVRILSAGQKGKVGGFDAVVVSHYRNGMYNVKTAGGVSCVPANDFLV